MIRISSRFILQLDKPGTPVAKARTPTPNAQMPGNPKAVMPPQGAPPGPGYAGNQYQRPPGDPYQRPPPDPTYGRPPMPYDPHSHVRTNGLQVPAGKP